MQQPIATLPETGREFIVSDKIYGLAHFPVVVIFDR